MDKQHKENCRRLDEEFERRRKETDKYYNDSPLRLPMPLKGSVKIINT